MKVHSEDIQQKLSFIDRTIDHAVQACQRDTKVPHELRHYVDELGLQSSLAQQALQSRDAVRVRETVEDMARISDHAQSTIHPSDGMGYELKSAVILTHIEVSALRHQLDS
ncbi:MAG TPA: hypothetical protein VF450_18075 [Noviherbaspirillum sp.]|jgi:hypothetical protein